MNILIADDEAPKLENLGAVVQRLLPGAAIYYAKSVRAALRELQARPFSLLVLDMSLPTFDVAPGEPGGRPQGFGGTEVIRRMRFYGISCPTLVVTQYEAFPRNDGVVDLTDLRAQLRDEFGSLFVGCVYYGTASGNWEHELEAAIITVDMEDLQ